MTGQLTIDNLKAVLPFITVLVIAIGGWVRMEMTQQTNENRIAHVETLLDTKAMTNFAKWQVNIERDIKELQKGCTQ